MNNIKGYECRVVAFKTLKLFNGTGDKIADIIPKFDSNLNDKDKQLARQICYTVIRHRSLIRYNYKQFLDKKSPQSKMRLILEVASAQYYFMDKIPNYAIINTSVELAKKLMGKSVANFTNALLQKITSSKLTYPATNNASDMAVKYSFPEYYVNKLLSMFDAKKVETILESSNREPNNWIFISSEQLKSNNLLSELGCSKKPDVNFPYAISNKSREHILNSPAFTTGSINIQDPAAWYITSLLDLGEKDFFLDYCGAPGTKTALCARRFPTKYLFCADVSHKRLAKIWDLKHRQNIQNFYALVMDGQSPAVKNKFNKILVDAPCSNSGVLSRRPEAKWRLLEENINNLATLQLELLQAAFNLLSTKGVVVYSTCSPSFEETSHVISNFLKSNNNAHLDQAQKFIPEHLVKNNCLHIFPDEWEAGGFFAARIVKQ